MVGRPESSSRVSAQQVRGHVRENQMTISYAIGRNSTEGRAHTMCIEGTQGTQGGACHPVGALSEPGWGGLGSAQVQPALTARLAFHRL